jgi:DMSO/TMAO reductase YedYZ heme-binding membrane subunit
VNLTWFIIRGSGLVAFSLLTASIVWGLLVSTKVFGRAIKAKGLQWLHESLGLAAVLATAVHMVALWADNFIEFTWFDLLIPGVSSWEPLAVTMGVVSFWTVLIVSLSFYVKKWIGQNAWRSIHYLSFGAFGATVVHGVMAGTDTSNPWVASLYVAAVLVVVLLTAVRVMSAQSAAKAQVARSPVGDSQEGKKPQAQLGRRGT